MGFGRLLIRELCLVICDRDVSEVDLEEMDRYLRTCYSLEEQIEAAQHSSYSGNRAILQSRVNDAKRAVLACQIT
jgi:hypothetical protein